MTKDSQLNYLHAILNARVYDVAKKTPLEKLNSVSQKLGHNIYIKREDTQPIFCYKIRGAYNKMVSLSATELSKGIVVASAGNHAQGVAISAHKLHCSAIVVMPKTTPSIKIQGVKRWGAKVELAGDSFDEAYSHAQTIRKSTGRIFISPFDDPKIIAGQGTVGMEIINQSNDPIEAIFVPIGGGGLAAGVAACVKQLRPEIKVIGVEPYESDAMYQSFKAGRRITLNKVGIFADGVAVKQVGKETFKLCRQWIDEIVRVNTDQICAAIKDIFEDTRTVMEPSGALSLAGIKVWLEQQPKKNSNKKNLVCIGSGANMNFDRLRHVSERAEIGEKREAIIAVTIPEKRGSFRKFYRALGNRSISEFNYRYATAGEAHIFVGLQIKNLEETQAIIDKLASKGINSLDLSDNEIAKTHARHIVGGRASDLSNERLFSFEFPERPGALGLFLDKVGTWNITLFHYRNHGSDYGRVLCGILVPPESEKQFNLFLKKLGYAYREETDNPVYHLFLS